MRNAAKKSGRVGEWESGRRGEVRISPSLPRALSPSRHPRSGLSLIEVLASIGIISIGLLGLASLLPVGLVTIFQATKADRAGNCGRMAMRELVVHRMLDNRYWYNNGQPVNVGASAWCYPPPIAGIAGAPTTYMPPSFLIDPLGVTNGLSGVTFGNGATTVPRATLGTLTASGSLVPYLPAVADAIFRGSDDIIATDPLNMKPAQPPGRPIPLMSNNKISYKGDYTWFATVTPSTTNPSRFTVSVVVCYARTLNPTAGQVAELAIPVTSFGDQVTIPNAGNVALAGGSIVLDSTIPMTAGALGGITVRENDWVALVRGASPDAAPQFPAGYIQWYRVAAIGDSSDSTAGAQLTLAGPDWQLPKAYTPGTDKLIVLGQEVVGVYTTTIDLDTDVTWKN